MNNRILISFILVLLLSCKNIGEVRDIRLGHGLDVNHSVHLAMVHMANDLDSLSQGKLRLRIYPNSQLGSERECLELLQMGSLDMTKVSVGVLENFSPKMKIFGVPYLFKNRKHTYKVLDSEVGQVLLSGLDIYWMKGLCYYDAGSRSFYTKERPVHLPNDLNGQKIRVMESVTAMDMVRSLGGSPTPIAWGELYTSLQQGVVDGAENNPPSFYLSKHYEVCKYYTLNEHTTLPDVLLAGTTFWKSLSEKEKKWFQQAVKNSVAYQRKLWLESERVALEAEKKAGVEVIVPDKSSFANKTKALYEQYGNEGGFTKILDKIQALE